MFEPLAFIARLAALIPLPRTHMRRFYGIFGPAHHLRSRIVPEPPCSDETRKPVAPKRPARMGWADLLARTFDIDGLRCPYCDGRMRVIGASLACSVFTASRSSYERVAHRVRAGVINWNRSTVGASGRLPFGGLKASGNGHPAALFSVLYCTYPVASLEDDKPFDPGVLLPGVRL